MTKAMKAKKRNPQDATLRNTRAQKALIVAMNLRVTGLELAVSALRKRIEDAIATPPPPSDPPDGVA